MWAEPFELARPYILWGFLFIGPYAWFRVRLARQTIAPYAPLQYERVSFWRRNVHRLVILLEMTVLAAGLLALAGPYRAHELVSVNQEGLDVVLALDISASMQAADFEPDRLTALKELAADFVRRAGTNRIGVYAFAKDVFTQSPLTTDHTILLRLIEGMAYESVDHTVSGGTAIGDALLVSGEALIRHRIEGRDQVIILITDGQSASGIDPVLSSRYLLENDIRLYVAGIGKKEPVEVFINGQPFINSEGEHLTTRLDDDQLKEIAAAARGEYFYAGDKAALAAVLSRIGRLETGPLRVERRQLRVPVAYFPAWAALVALLGWIFFRTGWIRRPWR